jgi:thioredoxin-like negative regulator of GroEL
MMFQICATFVQLTLLASGSDASASYADAHREMNKTGKPLVVMVGTDWCGPCQTMKRSVLPKVREHGLFRKVSFAIVNADREQKLARQIIGGGPVPQLVLYRRTHQGWFRRKLVGSQSVETVEKFIQEELAQDGAEWKTGSDDSAKKSASGPERPRTHPAVKVSQSG